MAQITLPDVKLPDFKLPDGLRDMSREDIVNAAKDVHLPKMEMPDIDFSNLELPKQISDRMPGRRKLWFTAMTKSPSSKSRRLSLIALWFRRGHARPTKLACRCR